MLEQIRTWGVVRVRKRLLRGFFIGEYHVEPLSGRVTGRGTPVRLRPTAIEILLCLASDPRSLVSREDLIASVWSDGDGSNVALSTVITQIRHALNDHPDNPKYVQTVPNRGYRLLVEPRFSREQDSPDPPVVTSSSSREIGLVDELNRRGVIETGVAYFIVGWLLIQVADVTFDQLALPQWAASFVTYFVIAGFPIALIFAWFIEITASGAILDPGPTSGPWRKSFSSNYFAVVGALVVASAGVLVYDRFVGLPGEAGVVAAENVVASSPVADDRNVIAVDRNAIAVLPFFNIDGGEETRIFSDGLAEDVINRLAAVPGLRVSSRGDSFTLEPNSSSQDVRNRLRVAHYVEGSVRITNDTLRVVAQLIDSADGFHIVSRSFDRELADFFEIQDEITNLIVANLRVALPSSAELTVPEASESTTFDAYLEYRRGMEILYEPITEEAIKKALDVFDRSLAVDPDYAAAHAGICLAYTSGYDATKDPAYIDAAESSCSSAIGLNPNLYVVHNALGILYGRTGRYEAAERAFEQALAINANDVQARSGLADVYFSQQRLAEAEEQYRQAIGLQPGNWNSYSALGRFLYMNGRYEDAANAYREVVSVDDENINGWTNLASSLMLSGDFAAASPAFERAIEMEPIPTTYANFGLLHYYRGNAEEATAALEKATEMAPTDYLIWSNLGDVRAVSGDLSGSSDAFGEAEQLAQELLEVNTREAETIIDLAWITAMLGRLDDAERYIARAQNIAPTDPHVHYINALVLARMDRQDAALDHLETAVEMGYPVALIGAEPHLQTLRSEPRFMDLIAR